MNTTIGSLKAINPEAQSTLDVLGSHYISLYANRFDVIEGNNCDFRDHYPFEAKINDGIFSNSGKKYSDALIASASLGQQNSVMQQKVDYGYQVYVLEIDKAIQAWIAENKNNTYVSKQETEEAFENFKNSDMYRQAIDNIQNNPQISDSEKTRLNDSILQTNTVSCLAQEFQSSILVNQQLIILSKHNVITQREHNVGLELSEREVQAFGFGIAATFDRNSDATFMQNHGVTHAAISSLSQLHVASEQVLARGQELARAILLGDAITPGSGAETLKNTIDQDIVNREVPNMEIHINNNDKSFKWQPEMLQLNHRFVKSVCYHKKNAAILSTRIRSNEIAIEKSQNEFNALNLRKNSIENGFHPFEKLSINIQSHFVNKKLCKYKEINKKMNKSLKFERLNSDCKYALGKQKMQDWCVSHHLLPKVNVMHVDAIKLQRLSSEEKIEFVQILNNMEDANYEAQVRENNREDTPINRNNWNLKRWDILTNLGLENEALQLKLQSQQDNQNQHVQIAEIQQLEVQQNQSQLENSNSLPNVDQELLQQQNEEPSQVSFDISDENQTEQQSLVPLEEVQHQIYDYEFFASDVDMSSNPSLDIIEDEQLQFEYQDSPHLDNTVIGFPVVKKNDNDLPENEINQPFELLQNEINVDEELPNIEFNPVVENQENNTPIIENVFHNSDERMKNTWNKVEEYRKFLSNARLELEAQIQANREREAQYQLERSKRDEEWNDFLNVLEKNCARRENSTLFNPQPVLPPIIENWLFHIFNGNTGQLVGC